MAYDLLKVFVQDYTLDVQICVWVVAAFLAGGGIFWFRRPRRRHFRMVKLTIGLGNVGKVELAPNYEDKQIAYKVWCELTTRKAAIRIDPTHDVIVEVYDSWYTLFQRTRELMATIPVQLLSEEESTRTLVTILSKTLNEGMRPHLTRWQARFRHWYAEEQKKDAATPPQDLQARFPNFAALRDDLLTVNEDMIQYAAELEKIFKAPK